jgi:biotin carboxylase
VTRFQPPLGPGVRVDTAVVDGAAIPPLYDSLIAKVVVGDATRDAAIDRAVRALGELEIEGIPTTRDLALDILRSEGFRSGSYSTSYLAEMEHRLPSLSAA